VEGAEGNPPKAGAGAQGNPPKAGGGAEGTESSLRCQRSSGTPDTHGGVKGRSPWERSDLPNERTNQKSLKEHETTLTLDLHGKKVIVIGERDGVQGQAIVLAARSGGAEVLLQVTQCFV
jgi:glycine reductase